MRRSGIDSDSLFAEGEAASAAYRNVRAAASDHASKGRRFAEQLWAIYRPYADATFLTEIRRDFEARFWEMYLTCALLEQASKCGYRVSCPKPGPDILMLHEGRRIWIEAVTATDGLPGKPDSIKPAEQFTAYTVPDEKIILRHRNAIDEKHRKYAGYRAAGIVNVEDAYVIALNGASMSYAWADGEIPRILKALYPLGALEIVFDRNTKALIDSRHAFRPQVLKANGAPVATTVFADDRYAGLSAVLFSRANATMGAFRLGVDFLVAHNPHAARPMPVGLMPAYRDCWECDGDLVMRDRGEASFG